jgi:DNA-binding NtrC family response regulator
MEIMKVLIADDSADFGWLLAEILRQEDIDVDVCQDPDVAIKSSAATDYNAIIVEPSPTAGFAPLLDYLEEHRSDGLHSVVMATTESDDDFMVKMADRGVFRILRKPLTRERVRDAVQASAEWHDLIVH